MKEQRGQQLYLFLGGLFIAALVASNLIFQKFFSWSPFGIYTFEISVGILPYPITFIVTDIISEIYGRKKANNVVKAGLLASLFSILIIFVADSVTATSWSPVNDETFHSVFGLSLLAVSASMAAYLLAQFIDIRIFHFWKAKTNGKHLWLRNNASTTFSQLVDTSVVLLLLCSFNAIEWSKFWILLLNGYLFKVIIALIDTPVIYAGVHLIRKKYKLELGEEL